MNSEVDYKDNEEEFKDKEEDTRDNEEHLIEGFNVELEKEPTSFMPNKCPIQLGTVYFQMEGRQNFKEAKRGRYNYRYLLKPAIFSIIYFLICSFILVSFILTKHISCIIIFIINYCIATIIQLHTFPSPQIYYSRKEFEDYIEKILNCSIKIYVKDGVKGEKRAQMPGEYVTDIIGTINIPKNINFIIIEGIDIFINSNLNDFKEKAKKTYKLPRYDYIYEYQNKAFKCERKKFMVNSNKRYSNIDFFDSILCILLLHWIRTLYYIYSSHYRYIRIFPAKLISNVQCMDSPTKINFQGIEYKPNNYTNVEINQNNVDQLENDYDIKKNKEKRIKEKEERRKKKLKEKEENTETLSDFSIYNFYDLEIIREFSDIYYILKFPGYKKIKKWLGTYDSSIEEQTITDEATKKIYIPRGLNIKISIIIYEERVDFYLGKSNETFRR